MSEAKLMREIQVLVSQMGGRVFRNNTGTYRGSDGSYVKTGLAIGSSDLIGWIPITLDKAYLSPIRVAVFLAIEVKSQKGRVRDEQKRFIDTVNANGGLAFIARSLGDVKQNINNFYRF